MRDKLIELLCNEFTNSDVDWVREKVTKIADRLIANGVTVGDAINATTTDAVEVVRCKDCKYWQRNSGFTDSPNGFCFNHHMMTNGCDFCSYGKKKVSE